MALHSTSGAARLKAETEPSLGLEEENRALKARIAELEQLVLRDTLTPLFNRRHFIDELDRWSWRTHRYGGENALLFIDVDQLKSVNDAHGHEAGDRLLVGIAKQLQANVRRSDVVARMGGDEFGMLLENLTLDDLPGRAGRIARSVAGLVIEYDGHKLRPGISVGYTMIEAGVSATELLARADRSMYNAKDAKKKA